MTTFAIVPGAGEAPANWDRVAAELRARRHDVLVVDLPCEDESAGLREYTDTAVAAIGERSDLVLVAHSLGGFTAPLVATRVPVDLIVLVAAMVPAPGETGMGWGESAGHPGTPPGVSEIEMFLQDVPPEVAADVLARARHQASKPMHEPWPLDAWPDAPTRFLLCREDRCFPAD